MHLTVRNNQNFDGFLTVRCWPCRLILTFVAIGVALVAESDLQTAAALIVSAFALDILRSGSINGQTEHKLKNGVSSLRSAVPEESYTNTLIWKYIVYSSMFIMFAVGVLYYFFANSLTVYLISIPGWGKFAEWTIQISYLDNVINLQLLQHNYPERATEFKNFFALQYIVFFLLIIIGCISAPGSIALNIAQNIRKKNKFKPAYVYKTKRLMLFTCLVGMLGFFAHNHLEYFRWDRNSNYHSLISNNGFFIVSSLVLSGIYFIIVVFGGLSMLSCINFNGFELESKSIPNV